MYNSKLIALQLALEKINYNGPIDVLGSGSFGTAYDIRGGRVLKITMDKTEYDACNIIKNRLSKTGLNQIHTVKVFECFPIEHEELSITYYAIVLEKLSSLTKQELKIIKQVCVIVNEMNSFNSYNDCVTFINKYLNKYVFYFLNRNDDIEYYNLDEFFNNTKFEISLFYNIFKLLFNDDYKKYFNANRLNVGQLIGLVKNSINTIECKKRLHALFDVLNGVYEYVKIGIYFDDIQVGNILKRDNNEFVVIDPGGGTQVFPDSIKIINKKGLI